MAAALADLTDMSDKAQFTPKFRPQDPHHATLGHLLGKCAAGDRDAFRRVFDLTSGRVFGIVMSVVRDRSVAEEVAQEVYVHLWRQLARTGPPHSNPSAWIATMARNRAIDRLRSDRVRGFVSYTDDVPDIAADTGCGIEQIEAIAVRRALAALRPEYRKVLLLSYFRGYTQSELADVLNMPIGTVKSWMVRGVEELREALS